MLKKIIISLSLSISAISVSNMTVSAATPNTINDPDILNIDAQKYKSDSYLHKADDPVVPHNDQKYWHGLGLHHSKQHTSIMYADASYNKKSKITKQDATKAKRIYKNYLKIIQY